MLLFNPKSGKIIVIEGVIAVGKSTLCKYLHESFKKKGIKCKVFPEFVDIDFLNLYISDMKKYSFAFQMFMLSKRLEILKEAQDWINRTRGYAIIDRSLHGDMAFALLQKENGNITNQEWMIYEKYATENGILIKQPDFIFYLYAKSETCLERSKIRNRKGEDGYTLDYFINLNSAYEKCMSFYNKDRVYRIDWNGSVNSEKVINIIEKNDDSWDFLFDEPKQEPVLNIVDDPFEKQTLMKRLEVLEKIVTTELQSINTKTIILETDNE